MQWRLLDGVHITTHFSCMEIKVLFKAVIKLKIICKLRFKKSSSLKAVGEGCSLKIAVSKFQKYKKL